MNEFSVLVEAYIRKKQEKDGVDFCAASWLDTASKSASQISIATHVLKYTNSNAKGTNIYAKTEASQRNHFFQYVSTSSLREVQEDIVGAAKAMAIAGLLQLEHKGRTFLDLIAKDDTSPLKPFAKDEEQLSDWMSAFKSIFLGGELSSHTLAKQVYFPTEEGKYHLLAPLYSSSLAQALYEQVKKDRFGDAAKVARVCKRKGEFSDAIVVDYPALAVQTFGGANPQNISRLNSLRGGKSYLLRSVPPTWVSLKKPPMKKTAFWRSYGESVTPILKEFLRYLWAVRERNSNKDIRNQIHLYIDQLLDSLMLVAAEVQSMEPNWSRDSEVPIYEQIWLDPFREDLQDMRLQIDWKKSISSYFATWVIQRLEAKKKYDAEDQLNFIELDHRYLRDQCFAVLKWVK